MRGWRTGDDGTSRCTAYANIRAGLFRTANVCTQLDTNGRFKDLGNDDKVCLLLGKRATNATAEDFLDTAVKRFLKKAWRRRRRITRELNRVFNRNDLVDKADAPQCTVTIEQAECEVSKSHFGSEVSKSHFERVCRQAPKKKQSVKRRLFC